MNVKLLKKPKTRDPITESPVDAPWTSKMTNLKQQLSELEMHVGMVL